MAELLIRVKDNWMRNLTGWNKPIEEAAKQYQAGDIVEVFPDGKLSDYAHAGGKFYVLRINGLDYNDALKFQEEWWNEEDRVKVDKIIKVKTDMIKRRIFRLDVEALPKEIMDKLNDTFVYNCDWKDIKKFMFDKVHEKVID